MNLLTLKSHIKQIFPKLCEHQLTTQSNFITKQIPLDQIISIQKYTPTLTSTSNKINTVHSRLSNGLVYYDYLINGKHIWHSLPVNLCSKCPLNPKFNASPWKY